MTDDALTFDEGAECENAAAELGEVETPNLTAAQIAEKRARIRKLTEDHKDVLDKLAEEPEESEK